MMTAQHTSGPWFAFDDEIVAERGDVHVAQVVLCDGTNPTEWQANLHLIAAAPELLAVCRAVAAHFDGTDAPLGAAARAAIAKAEGHVPPAAPLCIHGRAVCGICQEAQQ